MAYRQSSPTEITCTLVETSKNPKTHLIKIQQRLWQKLILEAS